MKSMILVIVTFFSFSALACRINIQEINLTAATNLAQTLKLEAEAITAQSLIYSQEFWPEMPTTSCPDMIVYYHAFSASVEGKKCSIVTKYTLNLKEEQTSPFRVLDMSCL